MRNAEELDGPVLPVVAVKSKGELAREASPELMALYLMVVPVAREKGVAKFRTDRYGNRILNVDWDVSP